MQDLSCYCDVRQFPTIRWRRCSRCKEVWPETDDFFPRVSAARGRGWHSWCRACFQERRRIRDAARRIERDSVAEAAKAE